MEHIKTTTFDFHPGEHATREQPDPPPSLDHPQLDKPQFDKPHHDKQDALRLGHLSDFHLGKEPADGVSAKRALDAWFDGFADARVDVLIVTGDLVEEPGDRKRLQQAKQMLDELPFPYLVVPGNHDVPEPGVDGPFEELFGTYPGVEVYEQMEFVFFDSMKGLPASERSAREKEERESGAAYSRGKVGREQMKQVEDRLDQPPAYGRAMLVHHHLRKNAPTQQGRQRNPTQPHGLMAPLNDADALVDWAHDHQVRLAFHGHKHAFWDPYEPRPGLVVLNSGSSILGKSNRPRRARLVDVRPKMESIAVHDLELRL